MAASAAAMAVSAMNRALSITFIFFAATTWRTNGSVLCGPVISQKWASSSLPIGPFGAGLTAEILDLVVIGGPLAAVKCDWRCRPELR